MKYLKILPTTLLALLTMVSTGAVAEEWKVIPPSEAKIVFEAPGLRLIPLSQVVRFYRHLQGQRRLTTCLIRKSALKYEEENVFRSMMPDYAAEPSTTSA